MSLRAENPRYHEATVYSPIFCHHTQKLLVGQALLLSHRTHCCAGKEQSSWHVTYQSQCLGWEWVQVWVFREAWSVSTCLPRSLTAPQQASGLPWWSPENQLAQILLPCDPPKAVWGRSTCRIEKLWSGSLGPGPAPPQAEAPARHLPTHTSLWILPPLLGFLTIFRWILRASLHSHFCFGEIEPAADAPYQEPGVFSSQKLSSFSSVSKINSIVKHCEFLRWKVLWKMQSFGSSVWLYSLIHTRAPLTWALEKELQGKVKHSAFPTPKEMLFLFLCFFLLLLLLCLPPPPLFLQAQYLAYNGLLINTCQLALDLYLTLVTRCFQMN